MKKKEEKEKQNEKRRSSYLSTPLKTLPCSYLEINGVKKCTHRNNEDMKKRTKLNGKEKHGFFDKRCRCDFCPLFNKSQYQKLFKK